MKHKVIKLGAATVDRFEFSDGTVWDEVRLPPVFYEKPKTTQNHKTSVHYLKCNKSYIELIDERNNKPQR